MKLYTMPGACSRGAHIALEWTGKPYEVVKLALADTKKADYLAVSPLGVVPAIVEEDGWILTEGAAILTYIADTHPEAKLGGDGSPRGRAELTAWLAHLTSDVHKAFVPLFAPERFIADRSQWADLKAHAVAKVRALLANLDRRLADREYPVGSHRTVVDAYLFVYLGWTEKLAGGIASFPNLTRVFARMNADPAVQKVLRAEET
ncbi:glutathione S-transferase family protein [Polyangium aurulentum]|uniref:glutathione S-transferase family protein n=1 Tax=Polyangium aurulentum TaxID=2567896 RepID=UPI0010ADB604|nr:glutathione S-transferase N-terminal domain-containing protein [Polyangium aurulentum]UQA60619.1 glutathione S-transferase N-terminal domain-containing protein [Polyangium aurulentum]